MPYVSRGLRRVNILLRLLELLLRDTHGCVLPAASASGEREGRVWSIFFVVLLSFVVHVRHGTKRNGEDQRRYLYPVFFLFVKKHNDISNSHWSRETDRRTDAERPRNPVRDEGRNLLATRWCVRVRAEEGRKEVDAGACASIFCSFFFASTTRRARAE